MVATIGPDVERWGNDDSESRLPEVEERVFMRSLVKNEQTAWVVPEAHSHGFCLPDIAIYAA